MPDATDLVTGDTAVLKSGGPVMTVQARSQNLAYCSWFEDGKLHHGTFSVDSLQRQPVAPAAVLRDPANAMQDARDPVAIGERPPQA
ncbi:MAG: putative small protein [Ramlibacter sp.]|nr:putative small protein [Ramlibacter sp.]MDB5913295.1 putative small protein [Ramlibacter sp.]